MARKISIKITNSMWKKISNVSDLRLLWQIKRINSSKASYRRKSIESKLRCNIVSKLALNSFLKVKNPSYGI
jgi:hypothetical protein